MYKLYTWRYQTGQLSDLIFSTFLIIRIRVFFLKMIAENIY